MKRSLFLASLLAACTQPTSDNAITGGGGGKADDIRSFAPKFCGINTLEAAGPVFVAEVCFGAANASSTSEGFAAVRVSYTDDKTEVYEVDDVETVDRDTRSV